MFNATSLSLTTQIESSTLRYNSIHKTWGIVTLQASCDQSFGRGNINATHVSLPADFVIAIDISASMRDDSKLAFVQATIEYLLMKLDENQTFSLVTFNHQVKEVTTLLPCTEQNKLEIVKMVKSLEASGSTNISEALFSATNILMRRSGGDEENRISTLMLFTDGLSTQGLSTCATLASLDKIRLPPGCVFNTFGFGPDQDSKLLHAIALKAQGVYYYVETTQDIPQTFGECVAGILSTRAHQIEVQLCAQDGARVVTLATPFRIKEHTVAKAYSVNMELLYSGESKSILFRLSLRSLPREVQEHSLLLVKVSYINTLTQQKECLSERIKVSRLNIHSNHHQIPQPIDQHLNRYSAATTITEAIDMSRKQEFRKAQAKLVGVIEKVQASHSGDSDYCSNLVQDLVECKNGMHDALAFQRGGIHFAHALSSMYFMERSTGLKSHHRVKVRTNTYGYTTPDQESERLNALSLASSYLSCNQLVSCKKELVSKLPLNDDDVSMGLI